ncbi:MAG TPA: hypothetical protein VMV01_08310, partial [Planctomycetota bacterium]|nr:hypothetical protein [Planctomycetota bacterium]
MRRLHTPGRMVTPGRALLAPLVAVSAIVGVALMALAAVFMLAVMLLPGARRRVKVFRFGGPGGADPLGSSSPGSDDTAGASPEAPTTATPGPDREAPKPRSYAEVVELWPFVLAASLLLPALAHAKLLVPMDDSQANHLKAYG